MTFVPDDITATKDKPPMPVDHEFGNVSNNVQHDAVFGEITDEGPNYRNVRTHSTKTLSALLQFVGHLTKNRSVG